jgi:hypothetical protein
MRDRLSIALLVPVFVLPLVVIGAGGDLELLWQELRSLTGPIVLTVQAQASPAVTATMTPSGGINMTPTMTPSGGINMTPTMTPSGGIGFTPTMTPSGGIGFTPTSTPSGGITPVFQPAPAPVLSRWGMISGSIILALIALWALNRRMGRRPT